jgi:hypothetical protein
MTVVPFKPAVLGSVEDFHRLSRRASAIPWTNPEPVIVAAEDAEDASYRRMLDALAGGGALDDGRPLCQALGVSEALAYALYYMAGHCRDAVYDEDHAEEIEL